MTDCFALRRRFSILAFPTYRQCRFRILLGLICSRLRAKPARSRDLPCSNVAISFILLDLLSSEFSPPPSRLGGVSTPCTHPQDGRKRRFLSFSRSKISLRCVT